MIKIPKILHFIWFGYTPNYVTFCIQNFKDINPEFKINFVHYTPQQLESIYFTKNINTELDKLIYDVIDDILYKTHYSELINQQYEFLNRFGNIPFIQLLADIFRVELINRYGGIYLDCDTFPIKPFDDNILSTESFCVVDDIYNTKEKNNYFMGSNKTTFISNYFSSSLTSLYLTNNYMLKTQMKKPFDFQLRRIKFFTTTLKTTDFTNKTNYIEHYSDFSWGRKMVQFTKFDNLKI